MFGKPKYGQKTGHKTWRVVENEPNVFRVLPPIKSHVEDGEWAIFLGQHFGYAGVDRTDASKTKARPFACPKKENYHTKMVTVACAECDKIDAQKALLESRGAALANEGKTEEEIDQILAPLKSWCKNHNQDRKWYINVMSQKGEFGVLAIPHKAMQKLKIVIKRLQEENGLEPIADFDKGVWFDFRRTGKGRNTEYDVLVVEELVEVGGRKLRDIKLAPLTDAQLDQALKECPDLTIQTLMRVATPEQVKLLVASSGDPEEVDAIFNMSQKTEASASPAKKPSAAAAAAAAVAPKPPPSRELEAFQSSPDEEALLEKQLAEARAKKAAAAALKAKAEAEKKAAAKDEGDSDELSPEELAGLFDK